MRIAWLEEAHFPENYYDALQQPLRALGHTVVERRVPLAAASLADTDLALAGFGLFAQEVKSLRALPEFEPSSSTSLCGVVPLVVILNKEYVALAEKLAWVRQHCVAAAFTVHHHAPLFSQTTGVPFHKISFGVDLARFASERAPRYELDLGFTGVIREDQTSQWRLRIWRSVWPKLAARGLRLFSQSFGRGVRVRACREARPGCEHKKLDPAEYVRTMQSSKLWLATTGPSDLVGTRYFEVMATGTTLCVCNRLHGNASAAYESLGLVGGRTVVMFDSLEEFEEIVANYTTRPEYEEKRAAIVRRAQALARRRFAWEQVAARMDRVLRDVRREARRDSSSSSK